MSDKKISKIPISNEQRRKNKLGKGVISCEVSGRYAKFNFSDPNGHYVELDIFTSDTNDSEIRKLSSLVLKKEELKAALKEIDVLN